MNNELAKKSIKELIPLLTKKIISPVDLTKSVIYQIKEKNHKLNAYINIYEEEAIIAAKSVEDEIVKGHYKGDLHGIPMAIKDNFYIKDKRITIGSKIHKDFRPQYDSAVVKKMKNSGAILIGTTNMHEYAWGVTTDNPHHGTCRNPWDTEKIPGGSSGGSGAALASNMTIASIGSDTGGSVRGPASLCGIVGLKPTYGRISRHGCFPLAWSLDHVGPMTKTVYDSALLLEHLAGHDVKDSSSANKPVMEYTKLLTGDVKDLVIGINEEYFFHDVDANVKKIVMQGVHRLEQMGAKIELVRLPSLDNALYAQLITITAESSAVHHQNLLSRLQDFGSDVREHLLLGEIISAVDYLQAQQIRNQISDDFNEIYKTVDVLISPTLPFTAPPIGHKQVLLNDKLVTVSDNISRFTRPSNLIGIPAISIPCGISDGLPVGMQIMGASFREDVVLNVAVALERMDLLNGETSLFH